MPERKIEVYPLASRLAATVLALYWLALVTGTHWPRALFAEPKYLFAGDKLLHFAAYGGLGFLLLLTVQLQGRLIPIDPRSAARQVRSLWLVVALFGLMDELTQPIFGRDFEWYDWVADAAGGLFGLVLVSLVLRAVGAEGALCRAFDSADEAPLAEARR